MLKNLKGKLDKGLNAVSVKSESLVEIGRTKAAIAGLEDRLTEAETALGRACYEQWTRTGAAEPALAEAIAAVDALRKERDKLSARLEQIRREEEELLGKSAARFCPACGKSVGEDAKFCMHCGSAVNS